MTADIKRLCESGLSNKDARYLTAADIIEYAEHRRAVDAAGPATVMNDIIWLRQAFLTGVALVNLSQPLLAVDVGKKDLLRMKTISKPKPSRLTMRKPAMVRGLEMESRTRRQR